MVSAILRLQHLGRYEEAALVAARVGAAKMGFWTTPDGTADALADDKESDGTLITEAEPGTFGVGPPGSQFQTFDPTYPHEQFDKFVKATLRGIASGVGVAYNSLANDLEGVNYSSIRQGVLEERDAWMSLQGWMIDNFHSIIFNDWLRYALLSGAIKGVTGVPLPFSKLDKFKNVRWQGRRWQWVDPSKDVEARRMAIEAGLTSRTRVAAEQGEDIDDVIEELRQEQEKAKKAGITMNVASAAPKPFDKDEKDAEGKPKKEPPPREIDIGEIARAVGESVAKVLPTPVPVNITVEAARAGTRTLARAPDGSWVMQEQPEPVKPK